MKTRLPALLVLTTIVAAGCGSSKQAAPPAATASSAGTQSSQTSTSPGALQAEAASAATGDIPDNQVYPAFHTPSGWLIKYPEGWAQSGGPNATVFRDKNNIARIVVRKGAGATQAQLRKDP